MIIFLSILAGTILALLVKISKRLDQLETRLSETLASPVTVPGAPTPWRDHGGPNA